MVDGYKPRLDGAPVGLGQPVIALRSHGASASFARSRASRLNRTRSAESEKAECEQGSVRLTLKINDLTNIT